MTLVDHQGQAERRRRRARETGRKTSLTTLAFILLGATVAMSAVWQSVHGTQIRLDYDAARREQVQLASDIEALRIKLQEHAPVAALEPVAREKLGLVDPGAESMKVVRLDAPTPAPADPLAPLVPEALAETTGK